MINFKLQEIDKIIPWGQEPDLSLHWFGLTDGDLWLTFGNTTIYEYSKEALNHWGDKPSPYNDYQLSRFIEDFSHLFEKIAESIPEEIYELTVDLKTFYTNAEKWLAIYETDEDNYSDFFFEEYDKLLSWAYERTFDSGHLLGGPHLSFFRNNDKVRIVWKTEHFLDNGIPLWTAKDGSLEMNYSEFIHQIKLFGSSFFLEMGKQVELSVAKDWAEVKINKERLVEEHQQRKDSFYSALALLEQEPLNKTDWLEITQLFKRMTSEVK